MPPRKQNPNKKPKDLNAPKRPASSYLLFNKERQKSLRTEHPDKKLTDLTKLVGAEWKTLTPEQKVPYETEANAAKEKYKVALEEYKKTDLCAAFAVKLKQWKDRQARGNAPSSGSDSDSDDESRAPPPPLRKRPKDTNAPKKALSAFFIFQTSRRQELKAEHPDKKNTELSKMTGAEWNGMSPEDKAPFEAQAKERKTAYQAALEEYKKTDNYTAYQEDLARWKEEKKNPPKRVKSPKKKKKVRAPSPPPSASETGSSESDDSSGSDEEDGDTRMREREDSTSSGEEYSSDDSD